MMLGLSNRHIEKRSPRCEQNSKHFGDSKNFSLLFNGFGDILDICTRLNEYCQNPSHKEQQVLIKLNQKKMIKNI